MTVRARLALTVLLAGLATAAALIFTLASAFQRFEHERTWERADGFIGRVVAAHPDLLDLHARDPDGFTGFLGNLLLYEPGSRLYLLASDGTVLASSGDMPLAPGLQVSLAPVQEAVRVAGDRARAPYVMGDDPETMREGTVVAARPLRAAVIRPDAGVAGYLYLVTPLPGGRLAMLRGSVTGPALLGVAALVLAGALIAVWIIGAVTRPLRELSDAVAAAARDGFEAAERVRPPPPPARGDDEFARLRAGFHAMLARLHAQWDRLRQLDRFRREGVSNLSHDLRSPLTATAAGLETLAQRWADDPARADDRALVDLARRNTAHAAAMVRALADFALLDEPGYRLQATPMDVGELIDDVALRFAGRAAQQGVTLGCRQGEAGRGVGGGPARSLDPGRDGGVRAGIDDGARRDGRGAIDGGRAGADRGAGDGSPGRGDGDGDRDGDRGTVDAQPAPPTARIDVELFERALANLLDNALAATPAGGRITLWAVRAGAGVEVGVADTGRGIAADELPLLFDRFYHRREGGHGLGLAIVRRIVALHGGEVEARSVVGQGTEIRIRLPAARG